MRYSLNPFLLCFALTPFISACAPDNVNSARYDDLSECAVEYGLQVRQRVTSLEFVNHCKQCKAVSFTYRVVPDSDEKRSGCFVPAETRVRVTQVSSYHILSEINCASLDQEDSAVSGNPIREELMENYRTEQCEIVGVFAD